MVRAHPTSKDFATEESSWSVCPFCGETNSKPGKPCPRCTLEDTPATRKATKVRIGPWYVLQSRNPAAPGMKFQTLQLLIRKGFVTPQSVVRSPTTSQLWQSAAKVKGLSREFGLCYSCSGEISSGDAVCPHCNRSQSLPSEVDALLDAQQAKAEVSQEETVAPPEQAAKPIEEETVVAEQPIHEPASSDVLSPRELAMVFQLGYDPPGTVIKPQVRTEQANSYSALVLLLSLVTAGALVYWWIHSGTTSKGAPHVQAVVQSPPAVVHLEAVVVSTPTPVPVAQKIAAPAAAAISSADVQALWNKALDAESHRDFATSLKIYQEIQALPSEFWPAELRTRLNLARQELSAGTY
jgi:hypothetical protein